MSVITVCRVRGETRVSLFLTRVQVVGSRLFLSSGWEGHCPVGIAPRTCLRPLRVRPMGECPLRTASGSAVHFVSRKTTTEKKKTSAPRPAPEGSFREKCPPKVQ